MRGRIFRTLAPAASGRYHERYIRDATADEYVLPEELALNVHSLIETVLSSPLLRRSYSAEERARLQRVANLAKATETWASNCGLAPDVLLRAPEWTSFRDQARELAERFGDIAEWERLNVPT